MASNDRRLSGTDTGDPVRMKSGANKIRQQGNAMDSSDQMLQGQFVRGNNQNVLALTTRGGNQHVEQSVPTRRNTGSQNIEQPQGMMGALGNPVVQQSGDRRQFGEHNNQPLTSIGPMQPVRIQNHGMQESGMGAKRKYSFSSRQETGGNNTNRIYAPQESDSSHLETDARPSLSPDATENPEVQSSFHSQPSTFLGEARKFIYGEHDYLDVAIVYAKADYDEVDTQFIPWLKQICWYSEGEPRIVLYDDEGFPPHNVESIEYIINRSMRIFIYLTKNFNEESQMKFIAAESVSNTRLANPNEAAKFVMAQRKWAVRPVHTKNEKQRDYKTPIGLNSVYGIDFFNKDSKHTRQKTFKLVQDAVHYRIRREWEERQNGSHHNSSSRDSYGGEEPRNWNLQNGQNRVAAATVPSNSSCPRDFHPYSGGSASTMDREPNVMEDKSSRILPADITNSMTDQPRHSDHQTQPETVLHKTRSIGKEGSSMSVSSVSIEPSPGSVNDGPSVCVSGDDSTNTVTGHSPEGSSSQVTQNSSCALDSSNTSMADGRNREEVRAEGIASNNDARNPRQQEGIGYQESSAQETMTHSELANNDSSTDTPMPSLETDAQPSTGFKYGEMLAKQEIERKLGNQGKSPYDVIENVQTYHGPPEPHVAPCASAPPDNRNSANQDTVTQERGDDSSSTLASGSITSSQSIDDGDKRKVDSAVQADPMSNSYKSTKHSGGRVVEVHHHYYGERHHHPKQRHKRSQEPQINITGCAVVQIGNQATVANSAVTTSTKIPRSERNTVDNDRELEEIPGTARKVLTSQPDDCVAEDDMPSDVSQDTPPDQSVDKSVKKNGSEDGVQEPGSGASSQQSSNMESWNIVSPDADRTTSTEDLRSESSSTYLGINGDNCQGELSDEDNSRQSTSNEGNGTTEIKDVLDDMLQTSPAIEYPTDWTPVKPGESSALDTSTTCDNLNKQHFLPEDDFQSNEVDEKITETLVEYTEPIKPADWNCCKSSIATSTPVVANKTSSCLAMVCDKENKDDTRLECSKCDKDPCQRQPLVIDRRNNQLRSNPSNIAISYCNELETRGHVRKCKTCPITLMATASAIQFPTSLSCEGGTSQLTDELD